MQLFLIRHGQPAWVDDGINYDNPVLTDIGRRQAELTAQRVADLDVDHLLVSPLVRAQETAAPIAAALGVEVEIDDFQASRSGGGTGGAPKSPSFLFAKCKARDRTARTRDSERERDNTPDQPRRRVEVVHGPPTF